MYRLAYRLLLFNNFLLKAFNYGSILMEMINRSLGLNGKEAKRKAIEKAKSDPFVSEHEDGRYYTKMLTVIY